MGRPHLSRRQRRTRVACARAFRPILERLEERTLLSGGPYLPPTSMLTNPTGLLSAPSEEEPLAIALDFLADHAGDFGLTAADLADPIVTSQYTDEDTGITHVYLRQQVNGLEVAYADIGVHLSAWGEVIAAGGGFVPGLAALLAAPPSPPLSAVDAVNAAAAGLGLTPEGDPVVLTAGDDAAQTTVLAAPGVSLDDITARQHYVPTEDGGAVLAWNLVVRTPDGDHWYDLSVNDSVSAFAAQNDWMHDFAYNVIPLPNESPQDGGFALRVNPAHLVASPFGWHDTNGAFGPEFTDTRGNNVDVHLDRNGDNVADPSPARPSGGAALDFSAFTHAPTQAPTVVQNQNIAQINVFYTTNLLHDVHYQYGFTEAAGNFQVNNYGRGGLGNDALQADAQDGGTGFNNPNFAAPPDGTAPRLQLPIFLNQRDSSLDNGVIAHEYGHGVSVRLTGGPANSNSLGAIQSAGMGEGWSDFYALMFLQRPTDNADDRVTLGTYVLGQPQTGNGVRRQPYSFNMSIDPITFSAYNSDPAKNVHNTGEIWASVLWDMNWLLINKYGYDSNLATGWTAAAGPGHAGNKLALKLVMDAMKLQPSTPSFTQARDAIIAADIALNGGADLPEIWAAFARRGLGVNASTTGSNATFVTLDFNVPFAVSATTPAAGATLTSSPTQYVVTFNGAINPATLQASDFRVNNQPATGATPSPSNQTVTFTFASNPAASQGLHTMTLAAGALTRAADGNPLTAFTGTFRFDATQQRVLNTSPVPGSVLLATELQFTFIEPVSVASVQPSDLVLSGVPGVTVTAATVVGGTSIRYTLAGLTTEGTLTVSLPAGAVTDTFGNPSAAFTASYLTDAATTPLSAPQNAAPAGSLVYGTSASGTIHNSGDVDAYTILLDHPQTVTVVLTPTSPVLRGSIQLIGPSNQVLGTATATAAGQQIVIQTVPTVVNSPPNLPYRVNVGAVPGSFGGYTLEVFLNAAAEREQDTGGTNNTRATAESIDSSLINAPPLGGSAQRAAVVGEVSVPAPVNLIVNGGFEAGTLSSWAVTPPPLGWQINNGTLDPSGPAPVRPPISGAFDAFTTGFSPSPRSISQTFTVPTTVDRAILSWADRIQSSAALFDPSQEFRVQVLDASGAVLQTVFSTNAGDPPVQVGPNLRSFDITALLQARAGQTLRLRFEEQSSTNTMNMTVDDVSLVVERGSSAPDSDFYSVTLTAGQQVEVAVSMPSFTAPTQFAATRTDISTPGLPGQTGTSPQQVVYRDLNNDGKVDMISANGAASSVPNSQGSIAVRLGNGDGTFGAATLFPTNGHFTRFFDLGDINGDGKLDVVTSNDDSSTVSVLLGNGNGTFAPPQTVGVGLDPRGLVVGDFNTDGRSDVAVAVQGVVRTFHGQANGTLLLETTLLGTGSNPTAVTAGDVNGDGRLDLVTADFIGGTVTVHIGGGFGFFFPSVQMAMGNGPVAVALSDLNNDGLLDIVTANQGGNNLGVRLGNGFGSFGPVTFVATGGSQPRAFTLGDVNGDGVLDLAVAHFASANAAVLIGDGAGGFGAPMLFATGANPSSVSLADVDGDRLGDLSTADAGTGGLGSVSLRLNTTATVGVELQDAAGNVVASASAGTSNHDGALRFVPTTSGTYYVRVFGAAAADYGVVVVRNGVFESEPNDPRAQAQDLTGKRNVLGAITPGGGGSVAVLTFSELPIFQPINGASAGGVTFGFTVNGSPSTAATVNVSGPDSLQTSPPFVVGPTAGSQLTMTFDAPTVALSFTVALGTGVTLPNGATVQLFDAANNLIATTAVATAPGQGSPNVSEGVFSYVGPTPIKQVRVTFSTAASQFVVDNVNYLTRDPDWYRVTAAGPGLQLFTSTPSDGPGEFANTLNPRLELFSEAGALVASGVAGSDGRNESILTNALTPGATYYVRLSSQNGAVGDYVLGVNMGPAAVNDSATTNEDTPVNITVLANDTDDLAVSPGTVVIAAAPQHGTVQVLSGGVVRYTPAANYSGPDSFRYTVRDAGGLTSNQATVTLTVVAVADAPALNAPAAVSGDENTPTPLNITAALADTDGSEVLSITISGVPAGGTLSAGTDNGGTWTLTPGQLAGLTLTLPDNLPGDAPFTLTTTATATESNGSTASTTTTIEVTVRNVAPAVAPISGPTQGVRGQTLTFSSSFTDVGPLDTHEATWNFDDGTGDFGPASATPGTTLTVNHVFAASGTYTVTLTVRDDDGGVTVVSTEVTITATALQDDPANPGQTMLVVGGTSGDDTIELSPVGPTGEVLVTINGVVEGSFSPTSRVVVYGQAGNDNIQVAGSIALPAWLHGGDGNDRLKGGAGSNVLLGGAGDDTLIGGKGRSLLIGGHGADRLVGNSGQDILIGGRTVFDADDPALYAIMAEWSSDRDYATRVANLRGEGSGPRANGNYFLLADGPNPTVLDDDSPDTLTGSSGVDWFFLGLGDVLTDPHDGEEQG